MMFKSTLLVSALLATVANAAILDNDAAASVVAASAAQRTRQLKGAKKGKSTDSPTPSPTKSAKKGKSAKKSSPTPAATVSDVLVATVGQTAGEVELELSQQAIDTIPGRRNLVSSVTDPTTSVTATTTCVTEDCIEILTDGSAPDGATCYRCDIVYTGGDGSVNLSDLATDTTTSIEAGDFTATLNVIVVFEGSGGIVLSSSPSAAPSDAPSDAPSSVSDVLVATVGQTAGEVELELSQQAIDTIPGRRNLVSSVTDPTTSVTATTTCVTEDCIEILTDGSAPDGATCYRCDIVYTGGDGSVNLSDLATDTTTSIEAGDFTATLNVIVVFEGSGGIVLSSSPSAAPSDAPSDAPSSAPSSAPSAAPSYAPSAGPSSAPSTSGTSDAPTDAPTTSGTPSGTSSGTSSGSSTSSGTVSVSGSPTIPGALISGSD